MAYTYRKLLTVRQSGHKLDLDFPGLPSISDWLIVARFDKSVPRDQVECTTMVKQLRDTFGDGAADTFNLHVASDTYELVIVPPNDDVLQLVREMTGKLDQGELLCDVAYWDHIGPLIEDHWKDASPMHRLDYVREAQGSSSLVLEKKCPEPVLHEIEAVLNMERE